MFEVWGGGLVPVDRHVSGRWMANEIAQECNTWKIHGFNIKSALLYIYIHLTKVDGELGASFWQSLMCDSRYVIPGVVTQT